MTVKKVYQAISAVAKDMAAVGISKDRRNQQQGFNFRGIDQVYNALAPMLAKHNLVILPRITERTVTERTTQKGGVLFYVVVRAEFDFVSTEDSSTHTVTTYGEAMDSGDKATNKAMSIAYKYAAFQAFCIPTEETAIDADLEVHNVAPQQHPQMTPQQVLNKFTDAANGMDSAALETAYAWTKNKLAGNQDLLRKAEDIYQIRKTELELPA
ncbi:single-stranded DNA-binding protein [Chimaeribacter arupi]|uniref:ERF family protein n=1 Tax=Chimaeribacter arupi TaxID=2060066 RepID=UPI000C7A26D7|nr:ERF family protein [Chimaeribacter arupi]PLR48666.1 single-stranded DNA-binding protein [Chimaeribacter arupi]